MCCDTVAGYFAYLPTNHQPNHFLLLFTGLFLQNVVVPFCREAIFRQNVRFIHSKNRSPITYNLAVNHLADMSFEELRLRNGRKYSAVYNGGNAFNKDAYTVCIIL